MYFHSEHRQLPWCRELWPAPRCEINPVDAEKLGVKIISEEDFIAMIGSDEIPAANAAEKRT